MTRQEFTQLRRTLGLNQTEMARRMGLSMRALQDVEAGERDISTRHGLLAERVALTVAVERGDMAMAPANVRREALALSALIRGE